MYKKREKKVYALLPPDVRSKSATFTMAIGCGINFLLFIVKLYVGLASNCLAIMGDAINNLADTLTCIVAVVSFILVRKKSNGKVPYGYGRMEYIADFLMSVVVCIVGGVLVYLSAERLMLPYLLTFTWRYFAVIAATAVVKFLLGFFYRFRNRKVNSGVLRGAMLDSFTDVGITVTTLIGFSLTRYANLRLDGVFGMIVAAVIIVNGAKLLVASTRTLLGRPLDEEKRKKISALLSERPEIAEVRNLHVHEYGASYSELVAEVVLTEGTNYDIITQVVVELQRVIKEEFGYEAKICIVR